MRREYEILEQMETFITAMSRASSAREVMQIEAEATAFLLGLAMGARDHSLYTDFYQYIDGLNDVVEKSAKFYGDLLAADEEQDFLDWGSDDAEI